MRNLIYLLIGTAMVFEGSLLLAEAKPGSLIVSRYSGVVGIAQLGDTEQAILSRVDWKPQKSTLPKDHALTKIRFTYMVFFPEQGIRAYFRNERVALLEIQDPFKGEVQGTRLSVFNLSPRALPNGEKWDEVLQQELGRQPRSRVGNGKFGSEAFFFDWGDVAFNASGPNELAIYRDPEIAKYRQKNFGRKVEMWSH